MGKSSEQVSKSPAKVPRLADVVVQAVEADRTKFTSAALCCPCYMVAGPAERERIEDFLNMRWWVATNLLLTVVVLTADDLLIAFLPKDPWDVVLQAVFVVALVVFLADLALQSARDRKIIFTLFWWLDLLASASMLLELTVITAPLVNALGVASGDDTSLAQAGRAARAGSRIGRLLKLLRVLRLVRVFRLFKMLRENPFVPPTSMEDDGDFIPVGASSSSGSAGSHEAHCDGGVHRLQPGKVPSPKSPFRAAVVPIEQGAMHDSALKPAGSGSTQAKRPFNRTDTRPDAQSRDTNAFKNHESTSLCASASKHGNKSPASSSAGGMLPTADQAAASQAQKTAPEKADPLDAAEKAEPAKKSRSSLGSTWRAMDPNPSKEQARLDRAFAQVNVEKVTEAQSYTSDGNESARSRASSGADKARGKRIQGAEEFRKRRNEAGRSTAPGPGSTWGSGRGVRGRRRSKSRFGPSSAPTSNVHAASAAAGGVPGSNGRSMVRRGSKGRRALRKIRSKFALGELAPAPRPARSVTMNGIFGSISSAMTGPSRPPRMKSALNMMALQAQRKEAAKKDKKPRLGIFDESSSRSQVGAASADVAAEGSQAFGSFLDFASRALGIGAGDAAGATAPNHAATAPALPSGAAAPRLPSGAVTSAAGNAGTAKSGSVPAYSAVEEHPADNLDGLLATRAAPMPVDQDPEVGRGRASQATSGNGKPPLPSDSKRSIQRWASSSESKEDAGSKKRRGRSAVEDSPLAGELFRMRRLEDINKRKEAKQRRETRRKRRNSLIEEAQDQGGAMPLELAHGSLQSTDSDESRAGDGDDDDEDDSFVHRLEKYATPKGANPETAKAMTRADGGGVGGIVSSKIRLHVMLGVMLILLLLPLLEYTVECDEEMATLRSVDDVTGTPLEPKLVSNAVSRYPNLLYFAVHGAVYVEERAESNALRSFDVLKVTLPAQKANLGTASFFAGNLSVIDQNGTAAGGAMHSVAGADWPAVPIGIYPDLANETAMWLDVSSSNRIEAIWSFAQTHVIIILLGLIAFLLNRDVENLLVRPIDRIKNHLLPVRGDAIRWLTLPSNKWSVGFGAQDGESLDTKLMIASIEVLRLSMKRRARRNFRNKTVLQGLRRGSEHFGGVKTLFEGIRRSSVAAGVTPTKHIGSPGFSPVLKKGRNRRGSTGGINMHTGLLKRVKSAGSVLSGKGSKDD